MKRNAGPPLWATHWTMDMLKSRMMSKAGPYIGPKGGLWADPQHTVHWDKDTHGVHPPETTTLTFHDKSGRGSAYDAGHLFTDTATGKVYVALSSRYEKVSPRDAEFMEDMGNYGVRGINTVKARNATTEEAASLEGWQRAMDAFNKAKKTGISKLGWTPLAGGDLANDSWRPPAVAERLEVPAPPSSIPGSRANIPHETVFIDRGSGVIYKRHPGSYDDYRQSVSQIPLTPENEARLMVGLAAMRGDAPPRPRGQAAATAASQPIRARAPVTVSSAPATVAKNLQFRKTREGDWAVFGPAKHIQPGREHVVHKRDGTTSKVFVKKVSGAFSVDGVPHVYGLLKGSVGMNHLLEGSKLLLADAMTVLFKSRSAPKYIRKVATKQRTKTGKIRYRYIYANSGAARRSQVDDKINLQKKGVHHVVSATDRGVVLSHEKTGEERHVTHEELHAEMASAYQKRFDRGAEALIRKYVKSAPVSVTNADDAKSTHEALAERFSDAGVDEETAKSLVAFLASRDGWKGGAKKALLTLASDRAMGKVVAPRARSIARGAENLSKMAGQDKVRARDVGKAAALRVPEGGFDARLVELQTKAKVELEKAKMLLGAIESTGGNEAARRSMVDYAATVLEHDASHELDQLATAYPSMADLPEVRELQEIRAKWRGLLAERRKNVKGLKGIYGVDATMYVPDAEGAPIPQRARYRLVEADDVIASHDPLRSFIQRSDYPEGIQERQYHSNADEQAKVRTNAQKLLPPFIVNTNSDAVNGPPIMTADGIVLGGNSRAMSLQVAYQDHPIVTQTYKAYLAEHAHEFGFAKGDIAQFNRPVLVREVEVDNPTSDNLGLLVRRYNENFTQGLDPRVDQVARGRLVSKGMLSAIADGMSEMDDNGEPVHATLNSYLSSKDGKNLVRQLQSKSDGRAIIDKRNRSQYLNKDGSFNEDGKVFIERVLVGHAIPDPDLLSEMLPSQVSALAASIPHVVAASSHGYDIQQHLKPVLQTIAYMRRTQPPPYNDLRQLDADSGGFGDLLPDAGFGSGKPKLDADGRKLLEVLNERMSKPRSVAAFFRSFATSAQKFKVMQQQDFGMEGTEKKVGPGWSPEEAELAKKGATVGGLIDLAVGKSKGPVQRGLALGSSASQGRSASQGNGPYWVPMSDAFGDWLWSRALTKSATPVRSPGGVEYLMLPSAMLKAKGDPRPGAKYVKRVATGNPKRPWRYYYFAHHGGGVHNKEHFVEGSRLASEDGHYHIHGVKDGKLIVSHAVEHDAHHDDKRAPRVLMTHDELADQLKAHHKKALSEHVAKLEKEHDEAIDAGYLKGAERIREEAKRLGHEIKVKKNWDRWKERPKDVPVDFTGHPLAHWLQDQGVEKFMAVTVKKVGEEHPVREKGQKRAKKGAEKRVYGNAKVQDHVVFGFDYGQMLRDSLKALDTMPKALVEKALQSHGWTEDGTKIPVTKDDVDKALVDIRDSLERRISERSDKESGLRPLMVNGMKIRGAKVYRGDETVYTGPSKNPPKPGTLYIDAVRVHSIEIEPAEHGEYEPATKGALTVAKEVLSSHLPVSGYLRYRLDPGQDWKLRVSGQELTEDDVRAMLAKEGIEVPMKKGKGSEEVEVEDGGWDPDDPLSAYGELVPDENGVIDLGDIMGMAKGKAGAGKAESNQKG